MTSHLHKSIFTFLIILSILSPGNAQLNCDNLDFDIPVIPNCETRLPTEVALFNSMAHHFGLKDTIQYQCTGREIEYTYKGEVVSNWKYNHEDCGQRFMLSGFKTSINFKLIASIPTGNNKSFVYEMIRPEKERRKVYFKSYQENGILPVGKYVEKNCAGVTTAEGEYALINEPSSFSYHWYNEEKRTTEEKTIESDKSSSRKGLWKFYDDDGTPISKIKYGSAKYESGQYNNGLCEKYDKNYQWNYYKNVKIPTGIAIFNDINSMLGRHQHLTYDVTHRGVVYYLNGEVVRGLFFHHDGKYMPWEYQLENHPGDLLLESRDNNLNVYQRASDGSEEVIKFSNHIVDLFTMKNREAEGPFERWNCNGQMLIKGSYTTIDTFYTISEESFSYETYETIITETEYNKATVRNGTWHYYNNNGEHTAVENYPGETSGDIYAGFMCDVVTPESREISKTRPNNFLLFNSMCHHFNLPYWISNDLVLNNKQYYFNGQPIETPTIGYLKNNAEEIKLKTPVGEIKIHTKSNDYAAGGTMGRPKRVYLNATITYEDGRGDKFIFIDNKLTHYQTYQGKNKGLYEKKSCNGNLLLSGQYCQIDSFSIDTSVVFNPETYEESIVITESEVQQVKSGVWKHYDLNGKLEKEETFRSCK